MTIRLLNLPGAEAIERRLRLNLLAGVKSGDHDLDRMIDAFRSEVLNIWRKSFSVLGLDDSQNPDAYYEVFSFGDDETAAIIEVWSKGGWDITGDPGVIALTYEPLAADLVRLSNRSDLDEGEGKTLMELEAMAWAVKAAPTVVPKGPSAGEKARNQAFLSLGLERRRPAA